MSIWLLSIPVASDTTSQKFRYVWIQGQNQSSTELGELGLTTADVNLGVLTNLTPELVFIGRVIIRYQGGNWFITTVQEITGSRTSQGQRPAGNYLPSLSAK